MSVYYNEWDKFAAQWLRNLIAAGHLPAGDVDERSIVDVRAADLVGYTSCHFFAGIGGWPLALRLAGWPDDRPVWSGSCPCQPFSAAGKGKGEADERHLWPEFRRLISECRPSVIFGEQVASAAGRAWFGGKPGLQRVRDAEAILGVLQEFEGRIPDDLRRMLQGAGTYSQGESSTRRTRQGFCSLPPEAPREGSLRRREEQGFDEGNGLQSGCEGNFTDSTDYRYGRVRTDRYTVQPGQRENLGQPVTGSNRQFEWVRSGERESSSLLRERDGEHMGREQDSGGGAGYRDQATGCERRTAIAFDDCVEAAAGRGWLAGVRADLEGLAYAVGAADLSAACVGAPSNGPRLLWVAAAYCERQPGRQEPHGQAIESRERAPRRRHAGRRGSDAWAAARAVVGLDGRSRRLEPGIEPLVDGLPGSLGRLRGYGNAIVPQVAAEFIRAYLEINA